MKIKIFLIFVSLFIYTSLFSDEVFLKNGTSLKGVVLKLNKNQTFDFLMRDNGEVYNIFYKDVLKIKYKDAIGKKPHCVGSYKNGLATITLKNNKVIQSQILIEDNKKYIIIDTKLKVTQKIPKNKIVKLEFKQHQIQKLPEKFLRVESLVNAKVDVVLKKNNKLSGKVVKNDCDAFSVLNKEQKSKIFYSGLVLINLQKKKVEKSKVVATTAVPGLSAFSSKDYKTGILISAIFLSSVGAAISSYSSIVKYNMAYKKQNQTHEMLVTSLKKQDPDFSLSEDEKGLLVNYYDTQKKIDISKKIRFHSQILNSSIMAASLTYLFNLVVSSYIKKNVPKKKKIAFFQKSKTEEYFLEDNTKFIFNYSLEKVNQESYYSSIDYEYKYNLGYSYRF